MFRKFCRLELGGDVPEASTLGRFRTQLVEQHLWDRLLAEIKGQLEAKNIIMIQGRINIIDATPIEAAQSGPGNGVDVLPTRDSDADWHVKNDSRGNKKFIYGFSVDTGVDEDGFIHRQSVTLGMYMTARSATLYCWAMKRRCTLMPRIVQHKLEINQRSLALMIRCNARAIETTHCREPTKFVIK
ncbi:MAG: IS5 family transposase [Arenicella sp.]